MKKSQPQTLAERVRNAAEAADNYRRQAMTAPTAEARLIAEIMSHACEVALKGQAANISACQALLFRAFEVQRKNAQPLSDVEEALCRHLLLLDDLALRIREAEIG